MTFFCHSQVRGQAGDTQETQCQGWMLCEKFLGQLKALKQNDENNR